MKPTTCTYHCSGCGRHFHSLASFDAHRAGSHSEGRRCNHPIGVLNEDGSPRFVALTTSGVCRLVGEPKSGVSVWTLAGAVERVRQWQEAAA